MGAGFCSLLGNSLYRGSLYQGLSVLDITQFFSLKKNLFFLCSSCFQVMNDNQVVDLKTSEDLFKSSEIDLTELYQEYDIIATEV